MGLEWKLNDIRLKEYTDLVRSSQELEVNIGAATYKIKKLTDARSEMDTSLRSWWLVALKELGLDEKKNYWIHNDGVIRETEHQPEPENKTGTNASELK